MQNSQTLLLLKISWARRCISFNKCPRLLKMAGFDQNKLFTPNQIHISKRNPSTGSTYFCKWCKIKEEKKTLQITQSHLLVFWDMLKINLLPQTVIFLSFCSKFFTYFKDIYQLNTMLKKSSNIRSSWVDPAKQRGR